MRRTSFVFCLSIFCCAIQALCVSSPYELHNLDKAWGMGYTGKGVSIGIYDTALNPNIAGLAGKVEGYDSYVISGSNNSHGTRVARFMAGKLNTGLTGAAYNANVYAVSLDSGGTATADGAYKFFNDNGVKIINVSWALDGRTTSFWDSYPGYYYANHYSWWATSVYGKLARAGLLVVYSAGNASNLESYFSSLLPRYDESVRAMINVNGIDYRAVSKNEQGQLVIGVRGGNGAFIDFGSFLAQSSGWGGNLNKGSELFSLTASSTYANNEGTSFAAPMISGTAALVQEKFPFLSGAQIADVLLSTANKDYIAPKVIIKKKTLVYIDAQSVPTDPEIKKQDLIETGYKATQAESWKNYTAITMTREQVFGQGILDAAKALNGLAILDANRLNLKDIWKENDRRQAFYTLKVENATHLNDSFEFSNDISQRLWKNEWHNPKASNTPYVNMQNITQVGLIKQGQATLILSGANSYEGDTLIQEGTLKITPRADGTGGSMLSNIYVRGDNSRLIVDSAKLTKVYIGDDNSKAIASIYANSSLSDISIGTNASLHIGNKAIPQTQTPALSIKTLGATKTSTAPPTSTQVFVSNNVENKGSLSLGDDGLSELNINGTYTQTANSVLNLNFTSQGNSLLKANTYNITQGAKLIYTPLIDQIPQGTILMNISLGELEKELDKFDTSIASTNGILDLNLHSDDKVISMKVSDTAYHDVSNIGLGKIFNTLTNDISFLKANPQYEAYIIKLANESKQSYVNAMQSLDYEDYLKQTESVFNSQSEQTLKSLSLLRENEGFMRIIPNFKYIKNQNYTGYALGSIFDFLHKKDKIALYNSIAYSYLSNTFNYSNIKSQILSTNLGLDYDLDFVNALAGISLGASSNTLKRTIELTQDTPKANYNNIFTSAQLGLRKNITLAHGLNFYPMLYMNYMYLYQGKFKEQKNALFASQYSNLHYKELSAVMGANLDYDVSLANLSFNLDLFSFYERKILQSDLKAQAKFQDYNTGLIEHKYTPEQNIFHLGFNTGIKIKDIALSLNIDSVLSNKTKGVNFMTLVWYEF